MNPADCGHTRAASVVPQRAVLSGGATIEEHLGADARMEVVGTVFDSFMEPSATSIPIHEPLGVQVMSLPPVDSIAMQARDTARPAGGPISRSLTESTVIRMYERGTFKARLPAWAEYIAHSGRSNLSYHPAWLAVVEKGLGQRPYMVEAVREREVRGLLPLVFMKSMVFGRFLVSMPYLNYGGVTSEDEPTARLLIDRAVDMAEQLDVRYLQLRSERAVDHPRLTTKPSIKVNVTRALPGTADALWSQLGFRVRNRVRTGQKAGVQVVWGGEGLLAEFYDVFSRNMRDLGTPVYSPGLFRAVLRQFPSDAELCVARLERRPVAAGLLLHGRGSTEVPSSSFLREYKSSCPNMVMFWNLLVRAIERGQGTFNFGRSSPDSPTFEFKKQWGGQPEPAQWQFYLRAGDDSELRVDHPRNRRAIGIWKRLPVGLTRWIGPSIARGIP
jgi:FemAB-related protein (PEP-CTERM system-associated)